MKKIEIEIPDGYKLELVNGKPTLIDERPALIEHHKAEIASSLRVCYWNVADHVAESYCRRFTDRKFSFGKWEGTNIGYVCIMDKQYIRWLLENTEFELSEREELIYNDNTPITLSSGGFKVDMWGNVEELPNKSSRVNWELLDLLKN